jgi:hypothetical protein
LEQETWKVTILDPCLSRIPEIVGVGVEFVEVEVNNS